MKKIIVCLLAVCMVFCMVACGNSDQKEPEAQSYEWTFTTALVENHALSQGIIKFAELLEEESEGRIKVNVQVGGVLGGDVDLMEQLSQGLIAAHSTTLPFAANYVPEIGVFDLPYLVKDTAHARALVETEVFKNMMAKLEGTGIKPLTDLYFGYRTLTANKEVRTPKDMEGIKIRLTESDVYLKMFKAVGAIPTSMAFGELYTALQNNTVDAQENPYFVILINGFDEVQDYVISTEHVYSIGEIYFSEKIWNELSAEDQALVSKCAQEAREWQYNYGEELAGSAVQQLEDRGNTHVITLTDAEKAEWVEKMTSIYPDFYDLYGEENIKAIQACAQN